MRAPNNISTSEAALFIGQMAKLANAARRTNRYAEQLVDEEWCRGGEAVELSLKLQYVFHKAGMHHEHNRHDRADAI